MINIEVSIISQNENCICEMDDWLMICTLAIFSHYLCEWMSTDI